MVIYALDTNTVSYAIRDAGGVRARMMALGPRALAIPAHVVYEVTYGLRKAGRRAPLEQFGSMVAAIRVLEYDADAADWTGRLRVELEARGTPIGHLDFMIAATALRHGCTLVTHNTREFSRVPDLGIEDWY